MSRKGIDKTDWPFLGFQNDYTFSTTSAFVVAARAAVTAAGETK